jgi:hypothetical protein
LAVSVILPSSQRNDLLAQQEKTPESGGTGQLRMYDSKSDYGSDYEAPSGFPLCIHEFIRFLKGEECGNEQEDLLMNEL